MRGLTVLMSMILVGSSTGAEPTPLSTRWSILFRPARAAAQPQPLPPSGPVQPLTELRFTGPMPAHPFVLGNFGIDGRFGIVNGGIELVEGRNAAIRLCPRADQFELEGRIAMKDYGGWFLLLGWDEELGNGYAVHNCTMKQSGSPWFITELRGRAAVEETTQELKQHEWRLVQEARVTVRENKLTVQVGAVKVLDQEPLLNYRPGAVIFGVYDTRYGPRPVRVESLRIRAVE
jgi:hypothetical protein